MPPMSEKMRAYQDDYRRRNQKAINERARRRYKQDSSKVKAASRTVKHGKLIHDWISATWEQQDGKCYLCGDPLPQGRNLAVDHDHTCCPARHSCPYCRRGLACSPCNQIIGLAGDDPERLRKIAENLVPVLTATRARIAGKPVQEAL